jgi:hydroxyacylglutathione hydrolase
MLIERSLHPQFVSNTYLVADREGGTAFFIDAGGPVEPLFAAAERWAVTPTHVLLTHHHFDHVSEVGALRSRWPDLSVLAHPAEGIEGTGEFSDQRIGGLGVRALLTPGHTAGMLAFVVEESDVFTGDTLFKGSVGGVRAPGSTGYDDLRASIMDVLMALPPETRVHPGHTDPTTIGDEWESNAFIRVWRGVDPEGEEPCTVGGEPATLVVWGDDYDGGHKAWIRWPDGRDDIVPGSQVSRG